MALSRRGRKGQYTSDERGREGTLRGREVERQTKENRGLRCTTQITAVARGSGHFEDFPSPSQNKKGSRADRDK